MHLILRIKYIFLLYRIETNKDEQKVESDTCTFGADGQPSYDNIPPIVMKYSTSQHNQHELSLTFNIKDIHGKLLAHITCPFLNLIPFKLHNTYTLYLNNDVSSDHSIKDNEMILIVDLETASNIDFIGLYGEYLQLTAGIYKMDNLFLPPGYKQLKGFSDLTQSCTWKPHYDPKLLKRSMSHKSIKLSLYTLLPSLKNEGDVLVVECNIELPQMIHLSITTESIEIQRIDENNTKIREIAYDLLRVKLVDDNNALEIESPTIKLVIKNKFASEYLKQIEHLIEQHNGITEFLPFNISDVVYIYIYLYLYRVLI